jgi:hypothetical protein
MALFRTEQRIATFGRSGDRYRVEARFSAPVQTGPGVHPAFCTIGTRFFPGVKRPGRGGNHPRHLTPKIKKEYNLYSASGTSWPALGRSATYLFVNNYIDAQHVPLQVILHAPVLLLIH